MNNFNKVMLTAALALAARGAAPQSWRPLKLQGATGSTVAPMAVR